mgnify:CR=1 FL=1
MQLIRCTKKLQKEMGLKERDLFESEPIEGLLGSWHANLIYINGKKCVLFVNDKTLFNFIYINLSRAEIRELSTIFLVGLYNALASEGFSENVIRKIIAEYESVQYAKSNNKSVLGSMNDLAFHYKYHIQSEYNDTVPDIIKRLNEMPMGALRYKFPIDVLKDVVGKAGL